MEKMRLLILSFLFLAASKIYCQDLQVKEGVVSTYLTISPARLLGEKVSPFYLHGHLEYFVSSKVSVAGDGYILLGETGRQEQPFKIYNTAFFGASYHFIKKQNDFYIGVQPGLGFAQIKNYPNTGFSGDQVALASLIAGQNFFASRVVHFFWQFRFVKGQHLHERSVDLTELRFSAGLGFNFIPRE